MIEVTTTMGTKMGIIWRHIDTFFSNGSGTTIYLAGSKNSISAKEDYETVKKLISTAIALETGNYMVKSSAEPFRNERDGFYCNSIDSMRECEYDN